MPRLPRNIQLPRPHEIGKVSALALIFVCIVLALSFFVDDLVYFITNIIMPNADLKVSSAHDLYMADIVGVSLVVFIFFLVLLYYFTPMMRNFLSASTGTMSPVFALSLLFAVGLLLTMALAYDAEKHTLTKLIDANGAWLAFFGFLITIPALFFSVAALQDLRRVINTFPDFAKRFSKMLEELKENENETTYVRIMAYTPLPGALALSKQSYESLKRLIRERESRVEVICLDEAALETWMKRFKGKMSRGDSLLGYASKPLDDEDINDAIKDVKTLLADLQNPGFKGPFATAHPTLQCSMEDMPRFYAYFTDTRAIVINPLYFPLDNLSLDEQPKDLKERYVELIGFETSDIYTINNLKETYKMLGDRCKSRTPRGPAPAMDIVEGEKVYEVTAELPGMDDKDIEVTLTDDVLTIKGEKREEREEKGKKRLNERRYGAFKRSLEALEGVDADKFEARLEKGVLKVTLPKKPEAHTIAGQ